MLKNITISQISQTNPLSSTVTIFFNNNVSLEMVPGGVLKMRDHDRSDGENDNIWASFRPRCYDDSGLQIAVEKFKKLAEAATLMAAEAQRALEMQKEDKRAEDSDVTSTTTTVL